MYCFIYAALTSAINTASVLLTIPFVLCSALYFSECAQVWAFHSLQVEKDSYIWVGGRDNKKSSRAISLFSSMSQAKCAHLFTHPISLPVDQRRQEEIMLSSESFVFGGLRNFPFSDVWMGPPGVSFLCTVKRA